MKRLLALAASAIAGAAATVLFAAPAQAHHPIISGKAVCQADGQWKIKWSVSNGNWENPYMRIDKVVQTPTANALTGDIVKDQWLDPDATVIGYQMVPGNTTKATLYVDAYWYKKKNGTDAKVHDNRTGEVIPNGICKPEEKPTATYADECDGTVNVHVVNPTDKPKTFKVTAGSFTKEVTVQGGKETDVAVPAESGKAKVEVKNDKGEWKLVSEDDGWKLPAGCAKPSATGYSDCTTFVITLTNPQGNKNTTAIVTYDGKDSEAIKVDAGKTVTYDVKLTSATEAKVKFNGWPDVTTISYAKPATCDTLPKTGMDTTTMIASGGGLAALGAVVFFLARRRMVQLRRMAA